MWYCYCIGVNLKIRIHFQWPILSFMAAAGCSGATPCSAFLDADNCCVMISVQEFVGCNCRKRSAETEVYCTQPFIQVTRLKQLSYSVRKENQQDATI